MARSARDIEREAARAMRGVETAVKTSERSVAKMAKAAKRAARPEPMPHRTAGDLIRETAEKLGRSVGMTAEQIDELASSLVIAWRAHYDALER